MIKARRSRFLYPVLGLLVIGLVLLSIFGSGHSNTKIVYSDFVKDLSSKLVKTAEFHNGSDEITGKLRDGTSYYVIYPDSSELVLQLSNTMHGAGVQIVGSDPSNNTWVAELETWGPIVVILGVFLFWVNSMQGGGSRLIQFGKAKTKTASKDQPKVTFADVAGADEAVAELQEIKEFLESPARFQALGAKIPKGVLLIGPPGTGKTLLARAVAGEAGVPFFSISGSDFVEMFVGVGASRVRDLFEQAKASAPSIVFMDEIDAVGRHRGAGMGGGHDEREQTLNQLLVEMDGFDVRGGVILIAATNRPDILDPALLRPGRFDRQVVVDRPDLAGRNKILEVHASGKPLAPGVELDVLAKRTPGFTGADLANLLNEAAILTARRNLQQIGMRECEEAIDRVLAGPERKTLVMSDHDKLVTAYHESGHALVGHVLPNSDPIHKVSIVARSRSLGLTFTLPEDRHNHSKSQLRDAMAMILGGRTAEELVFDEPTTGAENDIEKVSRLARSMVTEYGMSDLLGPQQLGQKDGEVFLGRDFGHQANYSDEVAALIDREVRLLIDEAHDRARAVLVRHRDVLDRMAKELVEKETLDALDLAELLGPLENWSATPPRTPPMASKSTTDHFGATPVSVEPPAQVAKPARPPRRRAVAATPRGRVAPAEGAGSPGVVTRTRSGSGAATEAPLKAKRASAKGSSATKPDAKPAPTKRQAGKSGSGGGAKIPVDDALVARRPRPVANTEQ